MDKKIIVTLELGTRLKDFRNQYKIKAKDVATMLNKSAAYVSKLEKGEIKQIEKSEFRRIVNFITGSEDGYEIFFKYASDLANEEEIEKATYLLNFDWIERVLPIPDEMVEFINNKLSKNEIDIKELVEYINKNDDIEPEFFAEHDIDKEANGSNIWYNYYEVDSNKVKRSYIWVELNCNTVEDILSRRKKESNYLTIYVILYHIFKLEILKKNLSLNNRDRSIAQKKTEDKLQSFKFYTLADKRKTLSRSKVQIEIDEALNKFDYDNRVLTTKLVRYLSVLSDFDVSYTNKKLEGIINNFEKTDISFAVAYMAISLEKLNDLPIEVKHNFLKGVNDLIQKCCDINTDDNPKFEKY